ncbi:MAG: UbiA family prenyltransferase [Firmicutes bacterium]|nr:UbiA family prenyltransferase [Bacillota bacterium]
MDLGLATGRADRRAQALIGRIIDYVEIRTKITSIFPFLMGLAYLFSTGYTIDPLKTGAFFLGMFCFDLTATMINNYCDAKKNRQTLPFSRLTSKVLLFMMFAVSVALGLYLVYLSDLVVLLLGMLCFFFGVIYSVGPVPLSHGPYGEIVSGFFYGLVIPGILFQINIPLGGLVSYALADGRFALLVDLRAMASLLLLSVVPFCLTANIMLANNICDVKRDVTVHRYTLAYYLGKKGLWLFATLYYIAYLSVVALVVLGFLSPLSLLLLLTVIPVQKNINLFWAKQDKEETFNLAVKNFLMVIIPHTALIFLGGLLSAR